MIHFDHVPVELYREIQSYSRNDDFCAWMNSSKDIFEVIKYQILSFKFKSDDLKKRPEIRNVMKELERKVANPERQIKFLLRFQSKVLRKHFQTCYIKKCT